MWKLEQKLHSGTSKHLLTQAQGRQAQSPLHPPPTKLAAGGASMTSCFIFTTQLQKVAQTVSCCQEHHPTILSNCQKRAGFDTNKDSARLRCIQCARKRCTHFVLTSVATDGLMPRIGWCKVHITMLAINATDAMCLPQMKTSRDKLQR